MKLGFLIYGSLDTLSGGYMYDRMLVDHLRAQGDTVEIISLPWRNYAAHLTDNFTFNLPPGLEILIQDELNHPSLIHANRKPHPYPIISLVHHLRCSELRPKWQNDFYRVIEKKYLQSVDGFIFNSETTKSVVNGVINHGMPSVVAFPPTDRFGEAISEKEIEERSKQKKLNILFLGNVIERKGLHTLLEAVRLSTFDLRLDIVGGLTAEPEYAKSIQIFITNNTLSSFVFLNGPLNNQPLIEKLKQAHLLVVPSSYEGFGIVYLEGMGFGLPAIGTTLGAAQEVIDDGVTGFLIQPGDAQGLADRLKFMNERRDILLQISLAARSRYQRQPKWHQTAGQIREFLLSFLGWTAETLGSKLRIMDTMIHTYQINGMPVQTGDIICTMNGKPDILPGEFWRLVGRLVPGDVDHVAIYLGPNGRCAEAGAKGVITFEVPNGEWDTERMARQRGLLFDTFYGIVSPLDVLGYSEEDEHNMRMAIAQYVLTQVGKPYNLNFFNAETEEAFYCSQLVYKAYQTIGIDMNTGLAMEQLPGTNQIIYPQEIWEGFSHRQLQTNMTTTT